MSRIAPIVFASIVLAACGDDAPRRAADAEVLDTIFVPDEVADATIADTIPETIQDTTPETIAETIQDTTPETTAETIQDTTPETIAETVQDTTPETIADTLDADVGPTCLTLAPDHRRHVVVSRPYAARTGAPSPRWQILPLEADGALGAPLSEFTLGRAYDGVVAFRQDGALAITAHDDGTIGVFTIGPAGEVAVLHEALDTGAYVHEVHVFDDHLLLVDGNWQVNGGGIYRAPLGCDGTVGPATLLYAAKLAESLVVRGPLHILAAVEAIDTRPGTLHLVGVTGASATRLDGVDLFPQDDEDFIASLAVTHDGRFALVGDNQEFNGAIDNRIGVASISEGKVSAVGVVSPLLDPYAIVASPHGDAMLVVSGYGNAVHVLDYQPDRDPPFIDQGEPTYLASRPQLPGRAVLVGGAFPDLVLVVEVEGIRRFRFSGGGQVIDLGVGAGGDGYDAIPGAIGAQP